MEPATKRENKRQEASVCVVWFGEGEGEGRREARI